VTSLVKGLSGMPLERVSASGVRAFPRRHIMTWALFMLASMSISYSIYGMDYFLLFLLVAYSALLALMVGGNYRNGVMARRVRDTLIGLERIGYEFWLDRDVGLVDFRDARGELLGRDMTAIGAINQALLAGRMDMEGLAILVRGRCGLWGGLHGRVPRP
jgi:hypothetical protein